MATWRLPTLGFSGKNGAGFTLTLGFSMPCPRAFMDSKAARRTAQLFRRGPVPLMPSIPLMRFHMAESESWRSADSVVAGLSPATEPALTCRTAPLAENLSVPSLFDLWNAARASEVLFSLGVTVAGPTLFRLSVLSFADVARKSSRAFLSTSNGSSRTVALEKTSFLASCGDGKAGALGKAAIWTLVV